MKLKHQYAFGLVGLILLSFGSGMLALSMVLGIPPITTINAGALIITGLGFAIFIKTLSLIRRIDIEISEPE